MSSPMTYPVSYDQEGKPIHDSKFRVRRVMNWFTMGATYASMYMGRYNLSIVNHKLSTEFGWNKVMVGTIITSSLAIYAFSALFNGMIADRIGGRRSMLIGAFGAVIFNFLFGLGAYLDNTPSRSHLLLSYFSIIWSCNMYFQSYSAVALIKVNSGWFHVKERGVFSAIFGTMLQSGRALIFLIGGWLVAHYAWQWVFFVPSVLIFVLGILTYLLVYDSPDQVGLPPLDVEDATSSHTGLMPFRLVLKQVFMNPVTLLIAFAEFCTGFIRHGFEQWFPRYMLEAQHLELNSPIFQKGAFLIVMTGVMGAMVAGLMSDKVFNSRRPPVAFCGYAMQIVALTIVWKAPGIYWIIGAFIMNSLAISMVHSMLSGTASMDFGGKKAAATAAGLFDGMQYLGGAVVGVGMGFLLETFGWKVWGPSMLLFSGIGALTMLYLWNAKPKKIQPSSSN